MEKFRSAIQMYKTLNIYLWKLGVVYIPSQLHPEWTHAIWAVKLIWGFGHDVSQLRIISTIRIKNQLQYKIHLEV